MLKPDSLHLELPSGYQWVEGHRGLMAVWSEAADELCAAGFGPDSDGALRPSDAVGRRALEELRVGDQETLVRKFSHGGLLRWITGARFSDPRRPFEELLLSSSLAERGVRTPRVIAARARRRLLWWELTLVTSRVEGATDIGRWIAELRRGVRARGGFPKIARAFGALVRGLHQIGFLHADLQPNNVLVEEPIPDGEAPRLWLIDLDRSTQGGALKASECVENLGRLVRFVERRERERGACLTLSDRMRFLHGYEQERLGRHELWRTLSSDASASAPHDLGWKLERAFGGEDPRES